MLFWVLTPGSFISSNGTEGLSTSLRYMGVFFPVNPSKLSIANRNNNNNNKLHHFSILISSFPSTSIQLREPETLNILARLFASTEIFPQMCVFPCL